MSVNVKALTITGASVGAVSYAACAIFVAIAPPFATTLGSYIVHLNPENVGRSVTLGGGLIGGLLFTAIVTVFFAVSGWIYNRLDGPEASKENATDLRRATLQH